MWSGLDCTLPSEWLCFWCALATRDGALREIWGVYMFIFIYIYIHFFLLYIMYAIIYFTDIVNIICLYIHVSHVHINYFHIGYPQRVYVRDMHWNGV